MASRQGKRPKIDWEGVETDWRIGKLTQSQIAQKYGVSEEGMRKRFKKLGITRDLSQAVKTATKAALIAKAQIEAAEVGAKVGEELGHQQLSGIEAAVTENVRIIESHRRSLGSLKTLAMTMAEELSDLSGAEKVKTISEAIEAMGIENPLLALSLAKATSLKERVQMAEKLANTLAKLVPAERIAHNIDEENGDSKYDALIREIEAEERAG